MLCSLLTILVDPLSFIYFLSFTLLLLCGTFLSWAVWNTILVRSGLMFSLASFSILIRTCAEGDAML